MEMEHGGDDHRQRQRRCLARATCRALSFLSPCSLPASRVDDASTPAATTTTLTTTASPAATVVKETESLKRLSDYGGVESFKVYKALVTYALWLCPTQTRSVVKDYVVVVRACDTVDPTAASTWRPLGEYSLPHLRERLLPPHLYMHATGLLQSTPDGTVHVVATCQSVYCGTIHHRDMTRDMTLVPSMLMQHHPPPRSLRVVRGDGGDENDRAFFVIVYFGHCAEDEVWQPTSDGWLDWKTLPYVVHALDARARTPDTLLSLAERSSDCRLLMMTPTSRVPLLLGPSAGLFTQQVLGLGDDPSIVSTSCNAATGETMVVVRAVEYADDDSDDKYVSHT